jgi:glycosyltransferase involved in cell wall biosynthesis
MKVCMLAYAHYLNDARIKCYVRTLQDHGHEVDVIALRSDGEAVREAHPGGNIFRIMDKYQGDSKLSYALSYLRFFLKAMFFLARRSFGHRYDVVHVHNMPNVLVYAAIVPKLFGARLLLDVHDLMTVNYMAKFGVGEDNSRVGLLKFEQRISAMGVNHVICADDNQRDYLVEHCGVARKKVTVLLNLPNEAIFGPTPESRPAGDGVFRIVYHGTIAHRLGIDLILRAMAKVVQQIPAELWMYGSGDFLPEALALSDELGLGEKARFSRSFFPVEQIPEIVSGMDLGIIGNRRNLACDKYMLPVKLLEYVYLGIPVVAPRLEVIGHYFTDTMLRYYEPENVDQMAAAIVDLYRNRTERERQAKAALDFYRQHNIQAQAEAYLDLLTPSGVATPYRVPEQQA